jgi:hypothetical protein
MEMMHAGAALQGTMQALIMLDGLSEHAMIVDTSLKVLHQHKTTADAHKTKLPATTTAAAAVSIPPELSSALLSLKPYYHKNVVSELMTVHGLANNHPSWR